MAQLRLIAGFFLLLCACAACTVNPDLPVKRNQTVVRTPTPSQGEVLIPVYRVSRGDTLYAIAWRYRLDYRQLAAWNNIRPPYTIHVGQKIRLRPLPGQPVYPPVASRSPAPTKPAPAPTQPSESPSSNTPPPPAIVSQPPEQSEPTNDDSAAAPPKQLTFRWPVKGKLLDQFGKNPGIDIAGSYGQAVLASEAGKVVYSGRGLKGYGDLIIIKHSEEFLSAYAHNSRLLVVEGEQVFSGQTIAQLGKVGEQALLHFEIRRHGKPVDPLNFLP